MSTPKAYTGNEPYIFISYAHKDNELVIPIIEKFQRDGYRVWYDEGIVPGSNWDAFISEHLDNCGLMIAFLSHPYLKSTNCKDELVLCRSKNKPMTIVYLDDVEMSNGLKMRYGRIQSQWYHPEDTNEFYSKLYSAEYIGNCKGE